MPPVWFLGETPKHARRRKKIANAVKVWYNYDAAGSIINVEDGTGPEPGASRPSGDDE